MLPDIITFATSSQPLEITDRSPMLQPTTPHTALILSIGSYLLTMQELRSVLSILSLYVHTERKPIYESLL